MERLGLGEEWARVREELRDDKSDVARSTKELRETVTELHPEPTATVELTEGEIRSAVRCMERDDWVHDRGTAEPAHAKLEQALRIESGVGGKFDRGPEAA